MKTYKESLNPTEEKWLRQVLGVGVYRVFSPSIQVKEGVTNASSFSIALKKGWLSFANSWKESESENSYYEIEVGLETEPVGIKYDSKNSSLCEPVSSVLFNLGSSRDQEVKKVEVYCKQEEWNDEELIYDFALVFHARNGFRFCLNVLEDVSDQLELTTEARLIDELLRDCSLRKTLQ